MKQKITLFIALLLAFGLLHSASCFAQDTIHVERVLVKNQLINAKTGKVMRIWWRKKKVKSGYIIKQPDGLYVINGKVMVPNDFAYTPEKQLAKTEQ
jgi:hypothetical protein